MVGSKSVVMLGWRTPAVEAARSLGLRTVVLYTPRQLDKGTVQPHLADASILVEDINNVEHVLRALHRVSVDGCLAVTTQEEWSATTAGFVARHLGVNGPDPETTILLRDKALQKRRLNDAGVETAAFVEIDDIKAHDARDQIRSFGFPCVLKPVAGAAALATVLIPRVSLVEDALALVREDPYHRRRFLVETFLPGEEWHVDGWIHDHEVQFLSVSRYFLKELTGEETVPASVTLDPRADPTSYDVAHRLASTSLRALGLRSGVFHLEAFIDPADRRPVFGECAARVGGAYIYETVMHKFGVDLHRAALSLATGLRLDERVMVRDEVLGWTGLAKRPRSGAAVPTLAEIGARQGVASCRYIPTVPVRPDAAGQPAPSGPIAESILKASTTDELVSLVIGLREWFADYTPTTR